MKKENRYDFRKKLLKVHEENIREVNRKAKSGECFLPEHTVITISERASDVIKTAVYDFAEFLQMSMCLTVDVRVNDDNASVVVLLADERDVDLKEAKGYRGFKIETSEKCVCVYGYDERGVTQGLYYLEDVMSFEKAPAVPCGEIYKKPIYSPQMVHSGYGLDEYPDEYLRKVAHEGRDAILIFTKEVNLTPNGYLDFNDVIKRAAKYGISVYAYSYIKSTMHPDDEGAEEYYENTYGKLFKECPDLAGVTLVGESVAFPSKDPRVAKNEEEKIQDGIPTGKVSPGWFPCEDYPKWLRLIQKVIRKYNKDADIVFWTYNWGRKDKEARLKLIENLPEGITLMATFEMLETRKFGNVTGHQSDYSLSFVGPGKYFESEAEAAKKKGIKLYSMTNTAGLTWDLGVIPYQPMPYQWIKRYKAMEKAHEAFGLSGLMETHHYGLYPSFISKLSKWCFWEPRENMDDILKRLLKGIFGEVDYENVDKALKCFSNAICYFTPSVGDLYGAFRIGPSYPLWLEQSIKIPAEEGAMFGNEIIYVPYMHHMDPTNTIASIRIKEEIRLLEKMLSYMKEGISYLEKVTNRTDKTDELINLSRFIKNTVKSGINSKKWYILKTKLFAEDDRDKLSEILNEMEKLLMHEQKVVLNTIPQVEADSRLGWEPSMLYMTDKWHLEWKLRQIKYTLESEIGMYKKCVKN